MQLEESKRKNKKSIWDEGKPATSSQCSQTKHSGSIPVPPKRPTMSTLGGTQTESRATTVSNWAQTDPEEEKVVTVATPRKKVRRHFYGIVKSNVDTSARKVAAPNSHRQH